MEPNTDQELYEQIDLYLDGSLSMEELQKFEVALKNSPALVAEIERLKIARSVIKNYALRDKLKAIHDEEIGGRDGRVSLNNYSNYVLKIAAGLVLLIIGIITYQFATLNSKELYSESYNGYQVEISRGDDQSVNDPIIYNYINGNYQDLIHIYESKNLNSNRDNFLAGSAYLKLKKVDKAIFSYNKVITEAQKGGVDEYLEDAEYFIAMAYLENSDVDHAYWFFSKIYHDSNHLYHDKVDKIFYWKLKTLKFRKRIFKS